MTLPGITFKTQPPSLSRTLPRMDIAAFVGLAARGPVDTPVVVEDVQRFRDIFGAALPLAWDGDSGQMLESHLEAAVTAFFRGGGERCWVVRVAQNAQTHDYLLPGLVDSASWRPAAARARCAGSWSDDLRVGTLRRSETLVIHDLVTAGADRYLVTVTAGRAQAGDLLQLTFDDAMPVMMLHIEAVVAGGMLRGYAYWWMNGDFASLTVTGVSLLLPDDVIPLALRTFAPGDDAGPRVDLDLPLGRMPVPGDLLRVAVDDGSFVLLPVRDVETVTAGDGTQYLQVYGAEAVRPILDSAARPLWAAWQAANPGEMPLGERLRFALWAWRGDEVEASLGDLAFAVEHPRYWGELPNDDTLFRREKPGPFDTDADDPRFPLAAPEAPPPLVLPVGMPIRPDPMTARLPLTDTDPMTRLVRDGADDFGEGLFLDPVLQGLGPGTLMQEAEYRVHVRGERLRGLHSLLTVREVSMIAVPDAVHPGWREETVAPPDPLRAPVISVDTSGDDISLTWTAVSGATTYTVERSAHVDFAPAETLYSGEDRETALFPDDACPAHLYYYRMRAERGGERGPWSNTVVATVPPPDFENVESPIPNAPQVTLMPPGLTPEGETRVQWGGIAGATRYAVQIAPDAPMFAARTHDIGTETDYRVDVPGNTVAYVRVRAYAGDVFGPWSNTLVIVPPATSAWRAITRRDYTPDDLHATQRGLLRFCAARGDAIAVLAVPFHYRPDLLRDHVSALTLPEAGTMSYAALYHPWLAVRDSATIQYHPPDGAVCGLIATRTIERGAWSAPANEALAGVLGLLPAVSRAEWETLFAAGINIIRPDPRGFVSMSAETLSSDASLRPLNVRRLLILLRRLALDEGTRYVFAVNNAPFRRLVRHRFEQMLDSLYRRGAFAGRSAEEAYRVRVYSDADRGQVIVELRVAPAQPLTFITVRLIQRATETLSVEEV